MGYEEEDYLKLERKSLLDDLYLESEQEHEKLGPCSASYEELLESINWPVSAEP